MRGAVFLAKINDAVVCDVGGTTADVGCVQNGFPGRPTTWSRWAARTAFRMPDLLSIGVGGGTLVNPDTLQIGPVSGPPAAAGGAGVRRQSADLHRHRGGGGPGRHRRPLARGAPERGHGEGALARIHEAIAEASDRMKSDARDVPLIAVGGGSVLIPDRVAGFSEVARWPITRWPTPWARPLRRCRARSTRSSPTSAARNCWNRRARSPWARAVAAGADADTVTVIEQGTFRWPTCRATPSGAGAGGGQIAGRAG